MKILRSMFFMVSAVLGLLWVQPLAAVPLAYVFDNQSQTAMSYDLASPSKGSRILLPGRNPMYGLFQDIGCLAISPDGEKALVGAFSYFDQQFLYLINLVSGKVEESFHTPGIIVSAAFSPDGAKAYALDYSGSMYTIDFKKGSGASVWKAVSLGGTLIALTVLPDGSRAYISGNNTTESFVAVVDLSSNTLITVLGSAQGFVFGVPYRLASSIDGTKVYVSNTAGGFINVIDTATNTKKSVIAVPSSPVGLCCSPDGAKVFVACTGGVGFVADIDVVTETVSPIPISFLPRDVSVFPDSSAVCVCGGGSIAVIDSQTHVIEKLFPGRTYDNRVIVTGIFGPSEFVGKVEYNKKEHKKKIKTHWEKSSASHVKKYEIFDLNTKVATVSAKDDLSKTILVTPPYLLSLGSRYRIRAVDSSGNVSNFVQLSAH